MIEGIVFDYGRTLADADTNQLFPGAEEILENLHAKGFKMAVMSRTSDPKKRLGEFKKYNLDRYFQVFVALPKEGTKKFDGVLQQLGVKPENCVVVGDRIKSEIVEGNKIGLTTIWVRQGKFADELPETPQEEPSYTVKSLEEIIPLIDSLR